MPPRAKLPAPIDRPLSRAYLREFSGWSTAYPPGLSEPTSLRVMENMVIEPNGALKVRPGLRFLTYTTDLRALPLSEFVVGSHEAFFLNDGTKAYLFAVRTGTGTVSFRVARALNPANRDDPAFEVLATTHPDVGIGTITPLSADTEYVKYLQIDNKILILSDGGSSVRVVYVGATKRTVTPQSIERPNFLPEDKPVVRHPSQASVNNPVSFPALTNGQNPRSARTLIPEKSAWDSVAFNVGYYYTFSNELGESMPSATTVTKVRRRWTAWQWMTPNAAGEPSTTETDDPALVADQLIIYPSAAAHTEAVNKAATALNVYAIMWSDQDPVPVEGMLVGSVPVDADRLKTYVRHSPQPYDSSKTMPVPSEFNRINYSEPSRAAQGLVVSDRMVLVNDPLEGAVIRWTSNRVGEYLNFTSYLGGGYKTLTSGNLYIPVCVKLWQNPQSADTITILCLGVDGYSAAFYMAPAQVASQSDATNVMGFEETTATPGTISPYGVEVLNNSLYHPVETELMKSTASNYNINHRRMTDLIANMWVDLKDKHHIVSSQIDNKIYLLVHNPHGAPLETGCWGNEVWVLDAGGGTAKERAGTWSRWLVQGQSLRKLEFDGRNVMSISRPEGIFCFDDKKFDDDYINTGSRVIQKRSIPWKAETNTQGANRAHDAWAHLQQVNVTLGDFKGAMRYGVRGWDVHGRAIDISKVTQDPTAAPADGLPWDIEDFLLVRRDMKEWRFYAESIEKAGVVQPSQGQVSLVQYRYTPASVNVGYEYGSIETFEYARDVAGKVSNTVNGVPVPLNPPHRA